MEKVRKKKTDEEKKRLEEELVEFRETFEDDGTPKIKTFIRTDVVNANTSTTTAPSIYKPQPVQHKPLVPAPSLEQAKLKAQETAKKIMQEAMKNKIIPPSRPPKPGSKKVEKTKMSNLETFKEELKQMQALREERKGLRHHLQEKLGVDGETLDKIAPAFDSPYANPNAEYENDPTTTNLYVCNIPKDTKVEDLYETFGTFGPLASAKILYPRPEEERPRDFLCGFVAYMSRTDAERSLCALAGERMGGSELRISWARPIVIPPLPFYVPPALRELAMPDMPTGLPFNAKPDSEELREFLQKYNNLPRLGASLTEMNDEMRSDYKKMLANSTVRVVIPTEKPLLALIHRVVEFLVRNGPMFEALLMARERNNPMYRFLFDNHHPTHVYYRWRLYSILQGEDRQKWRLEKFRMFEAGSWWQPPPHSLFEHGMPSILYHTAYVPKRRKDKPKVARIRRNEQTSRTPSISDEDDDHNQLLDRQEGTDREQDRGSEKEHKRNRDRDRRPEQKRWRGVLDDYDREKLEDILRSLMPEKTSIGDAMCWCVEHSDCSKEIVQCIYESLSIKETPLHKKIARVYLISDVLANCSARVRDQSRYSSSERYLPVFYFRQHFDEILLKIFIELNATLEGIESRLKAEQFRQRVMLCFRNWEENSVYPTDVLINLQNHFLGLVKVNQESDIDGEPLASGTEMDEDIDGMPMPEEDIDGVPIAEDDDLDGIPMEIEDIKQMPPAKLPTFKTSSWSTVETISGSPKANDSKAKSKWESVGLTRWERPETASAFNQEEDEDMKGLPPLTSTRHFRSKHSSPKRSNVIKATSNGSINVSLASKENDEERRKYLREIEVKVMKFQDDMEAKNAPNIHEEVANYRQKLAAKMEEKLMSKKADKNRSSPSKGTAASERHKEKKEERSEKERKERRRRSHSRDRSRSREREKKKSRRSRTKSPNESSRKRH